MSESNIRVSYPTRQRANRLREFDAISQIQQLHAASRSPLPVTQSPNAAIDPNVPLNGIPRALRNIRAQREASGSQWKVTVTFLQNTHDPNFSHCKIWLKGYKGNSGKVLLSSASESPMSFIVDATAETVQIFCQACGNGGSAQLDTSPTTVLTL